MIDASRENSKVSQAPYRPFGAFRFILALAVVFGHGGWLAGGTLGDLIAASRMGSAADLCFFVLSGFILAEAASTFYAGRWQALAINRILKIVPGFLGALILSLIVHFSVTRLGLLDRAVAFEGINPVSAEIWTTANVGY
ncbi:acyltransferase family protein, partial [Gillisia sp. Q332]|uniref:acyltransferase family protein n=1 Tax=Gillisia xinjiangensis TaxID=3384765 RepID=UPI00391D49D1